MPALADDVTVTIYSRSGCHLCDVMKDVVKRVASNVPFDLREIDISSDATLEERYGTEIPVLMIDGRIAAKYRITEDELRRVLEARRVGVLGPGESDRTGGTGRMK
jgi:hypothetical protein